MVLYSLEPIARAMLHYKFNFGFVQEIENNDDNLDLAVAATSNNQAPAAIHVFYGDGSGRQIQQELLELQSNLANICSYSIAAHYLNYYGCADLIATVTQQEGVAWLLYYSMPIWVADLCGSQDSG
jgi:hypothetical protein